MLQDLQAVTSDKCIPPDLLRNAQGIVLLDRTKAGFSRLAYSRRRGVALVRDPATKKWSAPAFLTANEASLGFQVGGEQAFYAILLMSTNATRVLTESVGEVGGEARGTVGNLNGGGTKPRTRRRVKRSFTANTRVSLAART